MRNLIGKLPKHVLKFIQECISFVPVIILGSGASAAFGIAGMSELARYLIKNVEPNEFEYKKWEEFKSELEKGTDLEKALHLVNLSSRLEEIIVLKTKELIVSKDIEIRKAISLNQVHMPLTRLLAHLNRAASPQIKIVTTNYDRLAEYAIDQAGLNHYSGFEGAYLKRFKGNFQNQKRESNIVEVLKVHGSLDWYRDHVSNVYGLPDDFQSISGFYPVMVTPGKGKYQRTYDDPFRSLITRVDELFIGAKSIFIVGFGFNDEHLQPKLYDKMRSLQTPILIISKTLTENSRAFIKSNPQARVLGIEEYDKGSKIVFPNKDDLDVAESLWDLNTLLDIIL
ncbi:SIR2 family protein [Psychrobacillus sp. FSL H8-0484]|uniref:SIR2 family protein n=1 Tax=Psychrobacillus sp. FSL H8-0484 TaxID=2921390 RepID=UPI0030F7FAC1